MEIIIGVLLCALWVFFLLGIFTRSKGKGKTKPKAPLPRKPVQEPHILPLEGEDGIEEIIDDRL